MHRPTLLVVLLGMLACGVAIGGVIDSRPGSAALAASKGCSKAGLSGAYGVRFDGRSETLGLFASVSVWRFDGKGGLEANESFSSEKTGPRTRRIAGKYVIKRDCTFQILFLSDLAKEHEAVGACVLVARRTEFSCLDVEEGWVATGTGTKI